MRKLMWFTFGFALTCTGLVYLLSVQMCTVLAGVAFVCAIVMLLPGKRVAAARILALVLLGASAACLWYQLYYSEFLESAAVMDGVTAQALIVTEDYSFNTGLGRAADGRISIGGKNYRVRAYLEDGDSLDPGTRISGSFRFRVTTSDGERGMTSHSGKGIFLLAYQKEEITVSAAEEQTVTMNISRYRRQICNILKRYLPPDVYPFANALLLGDTTDLDYSLDTQLKVSGIRHVAAVSGLHVSILMALVTTVTFRKRFLTALTGYPALVIFAALAGFTPSVNRACLMSGLMLLSLVLNREYDGATALSFSVLAMLFANPLTITSVSFQLSVVSVAGIFLFREPVVDWMQAHLIQIKPNRILLKIKSSMINSIAVTLSAMSLTTPLCAWYFGTVSLIGIVTNLLTLWIISFIFYFLMGVCLLAFAGSGGAILLGNMTAWLIRYVFAVSGWLASFPLACVYTESEYIGFWILFAYILLGIFLLSREKYPGVLCCCAGLGLCLALACSWAEPLLYDTVITVLDMGQGQCILLQSEGRSYLVDCGGDDDSLAADKAAQTLLSRGIARLDGLILTHMDRDHAGGAQNLLSRIETNLVILPAAYTDITAEDSAFVFADRDLELSWGGSTLRIYGEKLQESENENSLCILLDTEKCDILITGDRNISAEEQLLAIRDIPQVDVLVAGHHGSKFANGEALLDRTRPRIVCISAGLDNIYGHPAPEALERFQRFGCQVYRTDLQGNITIRR